MNYLGFIDKIEYQGVNTFLYFDSISLKSGRELIRSDNKDEILKIKTYRIRTVIQNSEKNQNYFEEGSWFILRERRKGRLHYIYKDLNDSQVKESKLRVTKLDTDKALNQKLANFFSLNDLPDANEEEIINLATKDAEPKFVGVYNVGHGNCNAVCEEHAAPLVYFDFGGGCATNARTYPKGLRFCMSYKPPVILSHWDTDHWVSATSGHFPKALDRIWLVPRQKLGPSHLNLARKLNIKGNLLIWPHGIKSLPLKDIGEIFKCEGKSLNNSGLGLLTTFDNKRILLPGDADYKYIDGKFLVSLDGLVSTHHGAKTTTTNYPIPKSYLNTKCVYSIGQMNSYKHPKLVSLRGHKRVGWINRLYTPRGHCAIGSHILPLLGCMKADCDLEITQV